MLDCPRFPDIDMIGRRRWQNWAPRVVQRRNGGSRNRGHNIVIEKVGVTGSAEHIVPVLFRIGRRRTKDRGEQFVVYHMKLGGNEAGLEVADETDGRRMPIGKTKELTSAGARRPLRDLVTILKFGVEDVGRAPPNAEASEMMAVKTSPGEKLNGGKTSITRGMIVDPGSMSHGKRPKVRLKDGRPVKVAMNHHGTGIPDDGLNSPFRHAILMVGSDPRKMKGLRQG